jgi:two-component system LytT family response regulator
MNTYPKINTLQQSKTYLQTPNSIAVQCLGETHFIHVDSITFLEGEGNYTFIHTNTGKKHLVSKTLKALSGHLQLSFIRVHKSHLVNSAYILECRESERILTMACGKQVSVSRRKIKEITGWLSTLDLPITA